MIAHIVAMSSNRAIGKDGIIPWNIDADLNYFKNTTLGHCVIYGRRTFESLSKPLSNRLNVVVSKTLHRTEGITVFDNIPDAIKFCKDQKTRPYEIFICGGEKIYADTMHLTQKIYLTYIDKSYKGDRFYPEINNTFEMVWEKSFFSPEKFSFRVYERKKLIC